MISKFINVSKIFKMKLEFSKLSIWNKIFIFKKELIKFSFFNVYDF